MTVIALTLCALLLAGQGAKTGKVESTYDKRANFSAFQTYQWVQGYDAYRPDAHKIIVAAIEDELAKLGFAKRAEGADVTIAYYTVSSDEVDLDALDELEEEEGWQGLAPTRIITRLVVIMRKPNAPLDERLWTATLLERIDPDRPEADAVEAVRGMVTKLFHLYPSRHARTP